MSLTAAKPIGEISFGGRSLAETNVLLAIITGFQMSSDSVTLSLQTRDLGLVER